MNLETAWSTKWYCRLDCNCRRCLRRALLVLRCMFARLQQDPQKVTDPRVPEIEKALQIPFGARPLVSDLKMFRNVLKSFD